MTQLQVSWMWADAGLVPGSAAHKLAESNPLRWSSFQSVAETIADLQKQAEDGLQCDSSSQGRSVQLQYKVVPDITEDKQVATVQEAISFLQAQQAAASQRSLSPAAKLKAIKIEALACYRLPLLGNSGESAPAAVVCFGSRQEVGTRLRACFEEMPQLMSVPILVTGKDKEVSSILASVEGMQLGQVHEDRVAKDTETNAVWVKQKLAELGLLGKPIVLIAFPVLARSAVDALVIGQGIAEASIYPGFPVGALSQELLALPNDDDNALKDGWIDGKLDSARKKTWAGKQTALID